MRSWVCWGLSRKECFLLLGARPKGECLRVKAGRFSEDTPKNASKVE
jgi:hypothetical protein